MLRLALEDAQVAERLESGSSAALRALGVSGAAVAAFLAREPERAAADAEWLAQPGNRLIELGDADYPALLAESPGPPPVLFISGNSDLLWFPQIAIVGSRNPTSGGIDTAADFAASFARSGLVVTSGLADGIDAAAHAAALDAGQPTIAVVGTGPDRVYPARNRVLATRIREHGCIVSEFAPGTAARPDHFPRRNRIIAGLALGTLVVEAAQRSGALITARNASEAGREVFAIPGSIHNPLARGCHRLIRDGAALVETSADVIDALGPAAQRLASSLRGRLQAVAAASATAPAANPIEPDPQRVRLLAALGHDPVGIDILAERSGLTVGELSSMLVLLELEGVVSAQHGRYTRRSS
ncbi:MAG: DNA protecting protein DprA [Lysobacteraceae bacterium SCN 69-123]|nr:MAG: DNA protecting protein DprA [Xanthomonadaceae bacterium SCN 69-123]